MNAESASLITPQAQSDIAAAAGRAQALLGHAKQLRIADDVSREFAANLRSQITTYNKQLESNRIALVKPLNDHVKRINDGFRGPTGKLALALEAVDAELSRDRKEQQRIADEAARKAAEEQERLRKEAEERARHEAAERAAAAAKRAQEEALEAGFSVGEAGQLAALTGAEELLKPVEPAPVPLVVPAVVVPAKSMTSEAGARVTFRKDYEIELVDIDLVPVQFLRRELNKAAVLAEIRKCVASKLPVPQIGGLRIVETETPVGA